MHLLFTLLFTLLLGCTGEDPQKSVESALAAKDFPGAIAKADHALTTVKDPAKAWRLESLRLEAQAAAGDGEAVVKSLARLEGTNAPQLTPALYRSLADKLGGTGAILVLDAGLKRFPDDTSFQASLDDLKKSQDPSELDLLKTLGYIDQ